jgi:hypothetical protein
MAVYLVGREGADKSEKPRIVEARTQASAIAHVARTSYSAIPLTTKEAMSWAKQGIDCETAGEDTPEPEPQGE